MEPKSLTVEELKSAKKSCEDEIKKALNKFYEETKVPIDTVTVDIILEKYLMKTPIITNIDVSINLDFT
jgi:hypothetical protein